jgi:hypothetical protein
MVNDKSAIGKKSRAAGARFELKVRKDLEEKGWITDKWTKNVDLEKMELIPAKRKFNPFNRVMTIGTGFPDFIAFRPVVDTNEKKTFFNYNVIGVEAKSAGVLDKAEKEKCFFLLREGVFKDILIARKGEKKGSIEYVDYETGKVVSVF